MEYAMYSNRHSSADCAAQKPEQKHRGQGSPSETDLDEHVHRRLVTSG
jgi:hypothetical protein